MKLTDKTGVKLRDAMGVIMLEMVERYNISRQEAPKLLAECLVRNCVIEEIMATADVLMGKNE